MTTLSKEWKLIKTFNRRKTPEQSIQYTMNPIKNEFFGFYFAPDVKYLQVGENHAADIKIPGWYYYFYAQGNTTGYMGFHDFTGPYETAEDAMKECQSRIVSEIEKLLFLFSEPT